MYGCTVPGMKLTATAHAALDSLSWEWRSVTLALLAAARGETANQGARAAHIIGQRRYLSDGVLTAAGLEYLGRIFQPAA